jgi:integrase
MARKPKQIQGVYEKNPGTDIWYIRYRTPDGVGVQVRKRIGSRQAAITALDKVYSVAASGSGYVARSARQATLTAIELSSIGSSIPLSTIIDDYLRYISDPSNPDAPVDTVNPRQRLTAISRALGSRPANAIKPYEIEDWLRGLKRKPGTLNRYKSDLSGVYRYAKRRGKVDFNPVRDARQFTVKPTVPRWLHNEEESALREILQRWIDECPMQYKQRGLVLRCHPHELTLALGTGMRAGNLYGLRWENVDFDRRQINLVRTKNGNPQSIPMIDDVFLALKALLSIQKELQRLQDEAILKKGTEHQLRMPIGGKVILWAAPRKWWLAVLADAKITDLRWHDLRHTFATRLMMHTGNLKIVQEACGHANITMTARYAHVSQTDLAAAMSALNRL